MQTGGYTEMTSVLNPFPATVSNGLDTLNVARVGGQWTHLFNGNIEANVSAAVAYGFGAGAALQRASTTSARSRRTRCRTRPGWSGARASATASTTGW